MRAQDKAATSRAAVHQCRISLSTVSGTSRHRLPRLARTSSEMKPVTDAVKQWKLMGIGALGVTGIAAMALGVSFAEAIRRIAFVIIGKG